MNRSLRPTVAALLVPIAFAGAAAQVAPKAPTAAKPQGEIVPDPKPGEFRVVDKLKLGGEGGWDYLTFDASGQRLFLSRSSHVMVVDLKTGKVAGDIPDTQGVHGIALAPELGRGFTSNGRSHDVTVFDLKTLAPIGKVETAEGPDAIVYDPASKHVFTMNGRGHSVTVIDAAAAKPLATIPLEGKPEAAVVDGGRLYVNLEDKSEIAAIDLAAGQVAANWSLSPGEEPTGLALDPKTHRLFSACHNQKLVVVDTEKGSVVTTAAIGSGVDGAAFDPAGQLVFTSNGDGTLSVLHEDSPDKLSEVQKVVTARGARTIALDPATHRVFVVTAEVAAVAGEGGGRARGRPSYLPDSFTLLTIGR